MEKTTTPPLASKPQPAQAATGAHHLPSADEIKGKWTTYLGEAKVLWGKLTDDELLQTEGQWQKLAGLVQQRYTTTREAAEKQVRDFLNKQH